jgi:hypothetical protein
MGHWITSLAKTLALGDDFIVLLDYYEASKAHIYENLFRISANCAIMWTMSLTGNGVTKVESRGGNLFAWTWGTCMIRVDKSTGTVVDSVFTK